MQELPENKELGKHPEVKRMQKRLKKHKDDLFRFVTNENLKEPIIV
jgi:hypothetical protein